MLRILFTLFLLAFLLLSSCDTVYFVAINNYGPPCRVNVKYYNKSKPLYYDNDTLRAKSITSKTLSKQIVRTNIDSLHYTFIAPTNFQIELMPKTFGTTISELSVNLKPDSILTIRFNAQEFKSMKHSGIISKGGLLSSKIFINLK